MDICACARLDASTYADTNCSGSGIAYRMIRTQMALRRCGPTRGFAISGQF